MFTGSTKQEIEKTVVALRHKQRASTQSCVIHLGIWDTEAPACWEAVTNGNLLNCHPSVLQWSLACATTVACPVSWVSKLFPGFQSHPIAPWSWRSTKVEGLDCLGMGEIILFMLWLCRSQLQTDLCSLACCCKNIDGGRGGSGSQVLGSGQRDRRSPS